MTKEIHHKLQSFQITELCHRTVAEHILPGAFCIDATAGNGTDTEFLCRLAGNTGRVLAFDIQESAVETASLRLLEQGLEDIGTVLLESHVNMNLYAEPGTVDCIMFNFGYLPGGDHKIATRADTSITAINIGLSLLKQGGIMSLCIYSGGDTGFEERDAILAHLKTLDPHSYLVITVSYFNRPNHPPVPAFILKLAQTF